MIQSIKRAFDALEALKGDGALGLHEISEAMDAKKTTACNILKTLSELGYVRKQGRNLYALGERLDGLVDHSGIEDKIVTRGRAAAIELSQATGEGATATLRRGMDFYRFAKTFCDDSGVRAEDGLMKVSPYQMATTWALLGAMDEAALERLVQAVGLPPRTPRRHVENLADVQAFIREISADGVVAYFSRGDTGERVAVAAPVRGPDGLAITAIGVYLPAARCGDAYLKKLSRAVKAAAKALERRLGFADPDA